jgi:DNA polymerase-3 subunit beta
MKVSANAGMLTGTIALAAAIIGNKAAKQLPVLGFAHLRAAGDALAVTSNILDLCLTLTAPVEILEEGELAVPAARLHALLAGFPGDAVITIESADAVALICSGRSRFRLPTIPVEDLPAPLAITAEQQTGRIELDREDVLELLRPAFAMSRETTRYCLNGLFLCASDGKLKTVATDGHRLARVSIPHTGLSSDSRLIVPAPAVEIIGKLVKNVEAVTLRCSPSLIAVEAGTFDFVSKLVDGDYPAYERVIPEPSGNAVTVDRVELLGALARIAAMVEEASRRVVGLRWISGGPLQLSLANTDVAHDIVEAEAVGDGTVVLNVNYLVEMVGAMNGERVQLDSRSAGDSVLITCAGDGGFTGITMPYRGVVAQAA